LQSAPEATSRPGADQTWPVGKRGVNIMRTALRRSLSIRTTTT